MAAKHAMMLIRMLREASTQRSLRKSWIVSLLKLENVLNPPQNPTTTKSLDVATKSADLKAAQPPNVPRIRQAKILAVSVPNGKTDGH